MLVRWGTLVLLPYGLVPARHRPPPGPHPARLGSHLRAGLSHKLPDNDLGLGIALACVIALAAAYVGTADLPADDRPSTGPSRGLPVGPPAGLTQDGGVPPRSRLGLTGWTDGHDLHHRDRRGRTQAAGRLGGYAPS